MDFAERRKSSDGEAISRLLCGVTQTENSRRLRQPTLHKRQRSVTIHSFPQLLQNSHTYQIVPYDTKFAHRPDKMLCNQQHWGRIQNETLISLQLKAVAHPLHLDKRCHLHVPQFHPLWYGDNGSDLLTKALRSTSEKCFIRPTQNESERMLNYGIRAKWSNVVDYYFKNAMNRYIDIP